jgi:C-terminal processing protease CtpA/Prc
MQRSTALSLSVLLALAGGLAFGSGGARADEKEIEKKDDGKTIEKRIEVVRFGGEAFLGVGLEDVEDGTRGARVRSVESESAAERAGIETGDVITRFDGEAVRSARQLARLVRETPPGRAVDVEVTRNGAAKTLTATLDEGQHPLHRGLHLGDENVFVPDLEDFDVEIDVPEGLPHAPGPHVFRWHGDEDHDFTMSWPPTRPRLGVSVLEIDGQLADYFGVPGGRGVLVSSVNEGSPAEKAGLEAGDVVLEFEGKKIETSRDLRRLVQKVEGGGSVTLKILRDEKPRDIEVALPERDAPRMPRRSAGVRL